ncbi:MAG TPA: class I SAM-dependent methyltransferase [Longimicrobium sp.]|nr:class I SAM-dependent methyltransferase [Longimicrobium sp.]
MNGTMHSGGSTSAAASRNLDGQTVAGFGEEWSRFDQSAVAEEELRGIWESYFAVFPWDALPERAEGFDLGCGSGRWARFVTERVGRLHCIDASADALAVARRNLRDRANCSFHHASVDSIPLADGSMDFGYSLGVLHHIPDPAAGLRSCVSKLKPGAPFLVYLYYAFDNRPAWFRGLWRVSDAARQLVSRLPGRPRMAVAEVLAATVYWPLARGARLLEGLGASVGSFPLSAYRNHSFYTMRTDALDRFGTRLEHRFTAAQIREMMQGAGLTDITFGPDVPFWCAVGYRA